MCKQFDVIIIGGGLGGLTAGATLAKKGKKVLLIEQHYIPGGCATAFKRKDYLMEVGLHEMDGLFEKDMKNEIFDFLNINENIDFVQVPELFRIKSNTIDFVHPHGRDKLIKTVSEKFPNEKQGLIKFLDFMDGVLDEIPNFPIERWKQILSYPLMPLKFPNIVKASKKPLSFWLDKYIKDEDLKLILQGNLFYYHDDPGSMSMIYYSIAQSSYINGGGHFIKGGSQQLSNYLTQIIEENKGQVLLGKKASDIIIEHGMAVGVSYKSTYDDKHPTQKIYADKIIANAPLPLIKNLVSNKESKKIAKKTDHLKEACALLTVYIGFKKSPKTIGCKNYSTIVSGDNIKTIHNTLQNNKSSWEQKNFVFVDYSQIDAQLAPEGKSVGAICAIDYLTDWDKLDKKSYKTKKEEVANVLIKRLNKVIPGIEEQIDYYEVGTAKTVQRFTLNPKGTAYGYAQIPEQAGMGRIPFNAPIKNLYYAGAWTFPGGGFTGAILSGYLCANHVFPKLKNSPKHDVTLQDHQSAELLEKKIIAANTMELRYSKPKHFNYKIGQYAVLNLNHSKIKAYDINLRSLSLVSHPNEDVLRFAMRLSDSKFKNLIQEIEPGTQSRIFGPMGEFSLDKSDNDIVFLVSGIGITPIIPFLIELEKRKSKKTIHLYYSNKTKEECAYYDLLQTINIQNFNFHPVFTKTQPRIGTELLSNTLNNFSTFDFYIVGTSSFIQNMEEILINKGVKEENIKVDDFG